ncbi:MAG: hypothetical protein MPJ82_07150 [Alphaproteobacteria bacterium]|nr:hypothetical protein [Alphaproteobacteria bacterium]
MNTISENSLTNPVEADKETEKGQGSPVDKKFLLDLTGYYRNQDPLEKVGFGTWIVAGIGVGFGLFIFSFIVAAIALILAIIFGVDL